MLHSQTRGGGKTGVLLKLISNLPPPVNTASITPTNQLSLTTTHHPVYWVPFPAMIPLTFPAELQPLRAEGADKYHPESKYNPYVFLRVLRSPLINVMSSQRFC